MSTNALNTGTLIATDPRLPADRFICEGLDVSTKPVFTVSEVAKFFFGLSPHWVRWCEHKGHFSLDSDPTCYHQDIEVVFNAEGRPTRTSTWLYDERGICALCGGLDVSGGRTRLPSGREGARRYTLADVEKMAHALAQRNAINQAQLSNALLLVKTEARVWGYLGE